MHPSRFSTSTFRKSISAVSACREMEPPTIGWPGTSTPGLVLFAEPPPISGFRYTSTVSPLAMCLTIESPRESASTRTHWSPSYVLDDELMQWRVTSESPKCTFVPGVQRFAVERGLPSLRPPRSCTSSEMGKSWFSPMLCADWPLAMMPLLRFAEGRLGELDVPVGQIASVEHLDPVRLGRAGDAGARRGRDGSATAAAAAH